LAAELKAAIPGVTIALQPSNRGRFEVTRDGAAVFEKSKLGRHAEPGEVLQLLAGR
jgi:predicted Rdx family selenoprotein